MDFFAFLSTEFTSCSKQPRRDIIVKRIIHINKNNLTRVGVEQTSRKQVCCKNDAFTLLATLPTVSLFYTELSKVDVNNEVIIECLNHFSPPYDDFDTAVTSGILLPLAVFGVVANITTIIVVYLCPDLR